MLHYTDVSGKPSDKTGICKYCGKSLTDPASILRGYGEICLEKHKRRRVRKIQKDIGKNNGFNEREQLSDRE